LTVLAWAPVWLTVRKRRLYMPEKRNRPGEAPERWTPVGVWREGMKPGAGVSQIALSMRKVMEREPLCLRS
jgi:hypothetical protein